MTEPSLPGELPARVCSNCGMPLPGAGDFCPHCGRHYIPPRRGPGRAAIIAVVVVLTVIVGAGTALALKILLDGSSASDEMRSFTVDEADLSFDLPEDWEEFELDKMQDALTDLDEMDELTDRMGVSSEQFYQMMASNIVLYVTAPHAVDGFLSNVNVIVADVSLPSLGTLELQYRALGATDIETDEVSTRVGDGYATTYTLELNGDELHGQGTALDLGDQFVFITVSSKDAEELDRLGAELRESLATTQ